MRGILRGGRQILEDNKTEFRLNDNKNSMPIVRTEID